MTTQVNNSFSFLLDALVGSQRTKDLNLFVSDTVVIRNGIVEYYLYNSKNGMVG